jgi:hypothetical protein
VSLPLRRVIPLAEHWLVRDVLETLGSPRALAVWLLYQEGSPSSVKQILELECNPNHYLDAHAFKRDWQATRLLSKHAGLDAGIDKQAVAIASAEEAEERCRITNEELVLVRKGQLALSPRVSAVFHRAARIISNILGPVPTWWFDDPDYDHATRESFYAATPPCSGLKARKFKESDLHFHPPGWSKGRTTSASGPSLSSVQKYGARPDVSVNARHLVARMMRDFPLWSQSVLQADGPCTALPQALVPVEGNVMLTVPKNAKTDRVICYEPHMNIGLQLSVGSHIRKCLKKAGVNLDDQSVNQRRALLGSKTGHLATIDLKSASDTVAKELVWELLPVDWAILLDDLRSRKTLWPDGTWRVNHKFSSMGNGFTFELESLIFYAIASATAVNVSVYGDDLVVRTEDFSEVCSNLEAAGFWVNTRKSFHSGLFRESCGTDGFGGVLVTPFYLRRTIKCLSDVWLLHNGIRECWRRTGQPEWHRLLAKWRDVFPGPLGPKDMGDGHYHVSLDESGATRDRFGCEGWWFYTYSKVFHLNVWGNDPSRVVPERDSVAALCAATGPKRPRSLWDTGADRREFKYKKTFVLSGPSWPGDLWG